MKRRARAKGVKPRAGSAKKSAKKSGVTAPAGAVTPELPHGIAVVITVVIAVAVVIV
jgi:hypothetical protein